MDGLLVVDKPSGPTSHDVVARMRRILRERRIGHTGTLDPLATGVLPLVIGRAARLARFLSAGDKSYQAIIRLGFATDTADKEGAQVGARYEHPLPAVEVIDRALDAFRGQFLQQPPLFSAKKIGGRRSYDLARQGPTGSDRGRTGVGPNQTGVGPNQDVDGAPAPTLVTPARMLPSRPPVTLDAEGLQRALHGRTLEAPAAPTADPDSWPFVRLLDSAGDLVAIAERMGPSGLLHPSVVLR